MSESTNPSVVTVTDDLDAFSAQLFGQSEPTDEAATSQEAPAEPVQTDDANDESVDTQTIEDPDTLAPDDSDVDETDAEEPEETQGTKPKKNRYQERIDELTGKWREAERQREADRRAFEERLKALESPTNKTTTEQTTTSDSPPDPQAKTEDGRDKYPLGEYDPNYIADLTDFKLEQKLRVIEERQKENEKSAQENAQLESLRNSWNEKLTPAQERYPDFLQKSQDLLGSMEGIDPAYEDYIAATIMGMDYGPDVLYYLASNPDEARTIINSGATKATIALGRLEAKFAEAEAEKTLARPKVSQAPNPPPTVRGAAPAKMPVAPDTDDLDAFERELFAKRKK